jgi:ubiquitin C-terminal hydrolase
MESKRTDSSRMLKVFVHTDLEAALAEHFAPEHQGEGKTKDNGVWISYSSQVNASRISVEPPVLIFWIARFMRDTLSGTKIKDKTPMAFPHELDVSAYVYEKQRAKYRLRAVAAHLGEYGGGHYVAYTNRSGGWAKYDDESVEAKTRDEVRSECSKTAYILFYERE